MNHSLLTTALLTIFATATHAETITQPIQSSDSTKVPSSGQTLPAETSVMPSSQTTPQVPPPINCKYHFPVETNIISQIDLTTWASRAATQSFDFSPTLIDNELSELKSCYTDQGWQGFNDALKKSGNIEAIKSQQLTVSSQVIGEVTMTSVKENQWKMSVPLQVVYQNSKEKLTQQLSVQLLVGRKVSGDLGIMQMIATPQQDHSSEATDEKSAPGSTAPTNTSSSTEPSQQSSVSENSEPITSLKQ
jgi:hypothetical protein